MKFSDSQRSELSRTSSRHADLRQDRPYPPLSPARHFHHLPQDYQLNESVVSTPYYPPSDYHRGHGSNHRHGFRHEYPGGPSHVSMSPRYPLREEQEALEYRRFNRDKSSSLPSISAAPLSSPSAYSTYPGSPVASMPPHQQPTYRGHIKTTRDAILLLSACDLPDTAASAGSSSFRGKISPPPRRVTRRLLDSERADLICSGSIFVWDEKEAGMRRWTDGKCWSASRVSGCFLTYRELEARKKPSSSLTGGPTSNLYKPDGLIKQSFSMTTTSGRKLHAISYFTKRDVREGVLRRVSEDPRFVGEGGGEWGLQVDELEYPDPISRAGDMPMGVQDASSSSLSGSPSQECRSFEESESDERKPAYTYQRRSGPTSPSNSYVSPHRSAPLVWAGIRAHEDPRVLQSHKQPRQHDADHPLKDDMILRGTSIPSVTPLYEAKGLLPIQPIPVHSKLSGIGWHGIEVSDRKTTTSNRSPGLEHPLPDRRIGQPLPNGVKRPFHEGLFGDVDPQQPVSERPRQKHRRSSSSTNVGRYVGKAGTADHLGGDHDDFKVRINARLVTPQRPPSWDKGQHLGPSKEHDSAIGALLSLRSSSRDEPAPTLRPPTTQAIPISDLVNATSVDKPSLSRSDRAALDSFSVRV